MRIVLFVLGTLLVGASAAFAQAPQPQEVVVRQSLQAAEPPVVGQRIALYVDVLFPGTMPRPPRVSIPDTPGLQTFRFESQGTTMGDRIDGRAYVGQRFEFAVFARRGGTFTIPGAMVTLLDSAGDAIGTATGSPTALTIRVPPGVDPSVPVIASTSVKLTEEWSGPAGSTLATGDAIKRVIHREAEDVPALAMEPISAEAPDGVRVYAGPPLSEDRIVRGNLTGRRTDTLTYVFERSGSYALPAIAQPWWNLRESALKRESVAGRTISVATAPAAKASRRFLDLRRLTWTQLGAALALIGLACLLIGLARRLAPRLLIWWQRERQRRANSEKAAFRTLLKAARWGDPASTYQAYLPWRARLPASERAAADAVVRGLEAFLYRPHPASAAWSKPEGRDLAARAKRFRAEMRRRASLSRKPNPLPPLNPVPHT
ncbi:hypothetical protein [Microvirga puerhi]|uniref:Protein BatD n=1 Tax=Microvirga puerhi TaxID=2876078 RepID=A0ABS7VGU1_9HYPH|nr:hypothetical protein [Microvirga puerhi]MBZ6074714.1 hypothetical protein [Microvirga puerhi]